MSTTTSPRVRSVRRRVSTAPGRTSRQRSGRGRPVTTARCSPSPRWTEASSSVRVPAAAWRAAASRPETSSSTPSCWAWLAATGSASTSTVPRPRRASSAASPAATVLRPGAPGGPHTASTRPGSQPAPRTGPVGRPVAPPVGSPVAPGGTGATGSSSCPTTAARATTAGRSASASTATSARIPTRAARSRAPSSTAPSSTTSGCTPWRRRCSTAAGSRPGASSPRTATSA